MFQKRHYCKQTCRLFTPVHSALQLFHLLQLYLKSHKDNFYFCFKRDKEGKTQSDYFRTDKNSLLLFRKNLKIFRG